MKLNINEVAKSITLSVTVEGVTSWQWRVKVATWLIRLASKIAGIGCEVKP